MDLLQLSFDYELVVDSFAGGGGVSHGIEKAIGRPIDIAINHSPDAILMHKTNHPLTKHYQEDVWNVDPVTVCKGIPLALAWFSPDCTHFSKAKGSQPRTAKVRGLAWVVLRWAAKVRPRVIMLENVQEFVTWGPIRKGVPVKSKKGNTFRQWKKQLENLGYELEYKTLKGCDYGTPTTRERLFIIARCDGSPIVWPSPTHGNPLSKDFKRKKLKKQRTAGEIIDFTIPSPSIFDTSEEVVEKHGFYAKRPLVPKTLERIAKGLERFVLGEEDPFTVRIKNEDARGSFSVNQTFVAGFLSKNYGGFYSGSGSSLNEPLHTITKCDHNSLVVSSLSKKGAVPSSRVREVNAFLLKYYGTTIGQSLNEPLHTITKRETFGVVVIEKEEYQITDICFRMLTPRELFQGQGFAESYIIDTDYKGNSYPKYKQVARCGDAVNPQVAAALVRANLPELCNKSGSTRTNGRSVTR